MNSLDACGGITDAVVSFPLNFTNVQIYIFFHIARDCVGGAEGQDQADCDNYCIKKTGKGGECDYTNAPDSIPCVCVKNVKKSKFH